MIKFSEKQKEFILSPFDHTFEVNEGTIRSGKTTAGVFRLAKYYMMTEDENHLIAAYNQEQAYRLFIDGDGFGLKHIFKGMCKEKDDKHGAHLELTLPKGIRKIYYKGGSKSNSVGSITGMSLGSVAFGEINLLHMGFIQESFRRTFAAKNRYHLADLNPPSPQHPVIKEVFEVQEMKWRHWRIDDNPIITEERKAEILKVLSKSPYLYKRDWLGERVMPEGVIYSMWDSDENIIPAIIGKRYEMFFAGDGGQSDATSVGCYIVVEHDGVFKLLNAASYYHSGSDTGQVKAMSVYAKEIKEFIQWCTNEFQMYHSEILIDPACKSLREELHLLGIQTRGADNNSKDVSSQSKGLEVGIERMQSLIQQRKYLLVDTIDKYSHYAFLQEIGMYVRLDNSKPIDKWNHTLDRSRYACNYFFKKYIR